MSVATTYAAYSSGWATPRDWMDWAARTLVCDPKDVFDPCPVHWDSSQISGLDIEWESPCYVNHPGSRGSAAAWWSKYLREQERHGGRLRMVWCAFSVEQFRQMRPSALELPGWVVWPRRRIAYKRIGFDGDSRSNSPSNWSAFWTNVAPATPPLDSIITRTGV